jgi:hypothetical protein
MNAATDTAPATAELAPVPAPRGNCPKCEGKGYLFFTTATNAHVAATSACGKCAGSGWISPLPFKGQFALTGWGGKAKFPCTVIGETARRYRITVEVPTPVAGRLKTLHPGQSILIPKYAVEHPEGHPHKGKFEPPSSKQ